MFWKDNKGVNYYVAISNKTPETNYWLNESKLSNWLIISPKGTGKFLIDKNIYITSSGPEVIKFPEICNFFLVSQVWT